MLRKTTFVRVRERPAFNAMTFREYLRWPGQRVTDKTMTDMRGSSLVIRGTPIAASR